jgi:Secretion system C-terminal sorting domain
LTCFSLNEESYFVNTVEFPWLIPSTETCEFVVSIDEIAIPQFKVYPNPASNELNIQCKSSIHSIEISDLTGRIVFTLQPNANQIVLNLESFSTGCYFITATTKSGNLVSGKFIKD